MASYIDFSKPSLWVSAASIVFNPTFWNIAAQSGTFVVNFTTVAGSYRG
ncbi:Phosphatidylethanolamine N-methyltransferase [Pyrenophora tritici-repentis]|nr:Phosphatidylethanolamine N-methyltransferase [Pyrenophora tritici-repentis]KAI2487615.1 Phosphatidylethanolamine N-methyltransferase [Pyrenophora tritici-repentis]